MSDEVGGDGVAVETSSAPDAVENSSLPAEAKEFIRTMNDQAAEEADKPAEPPPATADDDPQPPLAPKPQPAAPVRPTLSDEQKRLVRDSYLTEDDVADLEPAQVDKMLAIIHKRDDRLVRSQRAQQRERSDDGRFLPQQQQQQQTSNRHNLSEEYDEDFRKAFSTRDAELDELRAKVAQFEQHISAQREQSTAQQHKEAIAWFDDQFSKLGEEFVPVLGKGTARDIDPRSAEFAARDSIVKVAFKLAEIYPDANPEELFRKAVAANHSDVISQQHRAEINGQLRKQSGRRLGAGSSVRAPAAEIDPKDPDGKLRQAFDRMLQDNGSIA